MENIDAKTYLNNEKKEIIIFDIDWDVNYLITEYRQNMNNFNLKKHCVIFSI